MTDFHFPYSESEHLAYAAREASRKALWALEAAIQDGGDLELAGLLDAWLQAERVAASAFTTLEGQRADSIAGPRREVAALFVD